MVFDWGVEENFGERNGTNRWSDLRTVDRIECLPADTGDLHFGMLGRKGPEWRRSCSITPCGQSVEMRRLPFVSHWPISFYCMQLKESEMQVSETQRLLRSRKADCLSLVSDASKW